MNNLVLWQPDTGELLPSTARTPKEISQYAIQLSNKDKKQILFNFEHGHFDIALNYLWSKTVTALKNELSTVGIGLLGEMLGRADVDDDDEVEGIITTNDTIRLAEELGIVSPTDALRLRHTHELVKHFSQLDVHQSDSEEIDEAEAIVSLKSCIKGVLGRPKVEVAKKFVEFREALEGETLKANDQRIEALISSPYFFKKLTVSVLLNAAKKNIGASLEHSLANINVMVPAIWTKLRDAERWQIGHAYAEAFADGKTTAVSGLRQALLKVHGFDYVPENLRSDTFIKTAEAILRAHDGLNNFYNEAAPVNNLSKLGSTIPTPALPACITSLLCVILGNDYGVAWSAEAEASKMLKRLSIDRWGYYINNVLPGEPRILHKLLSEKPRANWVSLLTKFDFGELYMKDNTAKSLITSSLEKKDARVLKYAKRLLEQYYGERT